MVGGNSLPGTLSRSHLRTEYVSCVCHPPQPLCLRVRGVSRCVVCTRGCVSGVFLFGSSVLLNTGWCTALVHVHRIVHVDRLRALVCTGTLLLRLLRSAAHDRLERGEDIHLRARVRDQLGSAVSITVGYGRREVKREKRCGGE